MKEKSPPLFCRVGIFALTLALSGCASAPKNKAAVTSVAPAPYMRIAYPDADTVQLQIAMRQFTPARRPGPVVWLAGASHIGESNYYAALQKHLDAQTLVLYEGVGEHPRKTRGARTNVRPPGRAPAHAPADDSAGVGSLQGTMARSLGLVFQLQAIDYERANFQNSDLSLEQLQALMESASARPSRNGTNAAPADNALQDLIRAMDGSSVFGALATGLLQIIGGSPKLQALTKLTLIEVFGQLKGDMAQLQGLPPEMKQLLNVLIRERNKVVIEDLKAELKTRKTTDSIVIFYGAGHLADMEKRLRKELKYVPGTQVWLPAFSVNTTRAGLSDFELSLMRSFVRSQLGPLNE